MAEHPGRTDVKEQERILLIKDNKGIAELYRFRRPLPFPSSLSRTLTSPTFAAKA